MKKLILFFTLALLSSEAFALKLKVGVLAPDGTTWATNLKKLSKEISKATDGKVKIKYYLICIYLNIDILFIPLSITRWSISRTYKTRTCFC